MAASESGSPLRIHLLQHVPFEGPANVGEWARERGHELAEAHLYRGEPLPDATAFDWLVVLGGPMSANDEHLHPWLREEKRLIARALEAGRGLFGVCLGAQLLAAALGARVYPAREKEIGWLPVRARPEASGSVFEAAPPELVPFHWHGETFDLPPGARHLAETDACPHQAFAVGERALGLQFHIEATPESVAALVEHCKDEITGGPHQQAPERILAERGRIDAIRPLLFAVLDALAERCRRP